MSSGPAAPRFIRRDLDRRVPDMDYDEDDVVTVSSEGRAPDLNSGSHGFDSRTDHHNCRLVTDANAETGVTQEPEGGGRT